ncbi:hypothetical protein [Ideonella livida]|uniref:Uncharacterized protein n=1 Tax=Ideonella livida TaxID=2707176 RepID=A0A7C9PJH6_9BURK|nr:hypothetical protein [Ideonella livida]NDY93535.1 hypothetical protein [Ideonella livida]
MALHVLVILTSHDEGAAPSQPFVVQDDVGCLITGQSPQSSDAVAEQLPAVLRGPPA